MVWISQKLCLEEVGDITMDGYPIKFITWWANSRVYWQLTDTVYLVHRTGIQTLNPWVSKQRHCILKYAKLEEVSDRNIDMLI